MIREISRNYWTRFCKKFSASNRYRAATVKVKQTDGNEVLLNQASPFIGVTVLKQGRVIDGVEMFVGRPDPEKLTEPVVSLKQPIEIHLQEDKNGINNLLSVEAEDGTVATVVLSGEGGSAQLHRLIEQIAYAISERRGFLPNNDVDDWLHAERKVKETELLLNKQ